MDFCEAAYIRKLGASHSRLVMKPLGLKVPNSKGRAAKQLLKKERCFWRRKCKLKMNNVQKEPARSLLHIAKVREWSLALPLRGWVTNLHKNIDEEIVLALLGQHVSHRPIVLATKLGSPTPKMQRARLSSPPPSVQRDPQTATNKVDLSKEISVSFWKEHWWHVCC